MSSMKMGLDQAVLQGIENGGNKDVMTKEEVERLLKNGAYDIFREDKDGSGDKESNDFVSQDIDSILERRAKTIVHENTGSKSNAAGGTFSKASFTNTNEAEVDIDDPDFWSKVVGEVKDDGDDDILASGVKRKRERTNYSEKEMMKDFERAIGRYADYEDINENNSGISEYSDKASGSSDDEDLDGFQSEALKKIVKDMKNSHKKKDERHQWGGINLTHWNKDGKYLLYFNFEVM